MGDGRQGFPEGAPYDAIHVGAAAPNVPKSVRKLVLISFLSEGLILTTLIFSSVLKLLEQLKPGGRLILPVGPTSGSQMLMQYDRQRDGTFIKKALMGVMYVPLIDRRHQWPGYCVHTNIHTLLKES